jgi:hypothetical protein
MERLKEIEAELSGIAPILGKNGITVQPYRVPAGYFEHFAESLLVKIRREADDPDAEIQAISPLLAGLNRKVPYQVPEGYFDEFRVQKEKQEAVYIPPVEIITHDQEKIRPAARAIPPRSIRPHLKYAAAAVITGIIAGAAFLTLHNQNSPDPLKSLTTVSDQEMANYLENQDVHWVPGASASTPTATAEFNDAEISELLGNVSDAELEQYLPDLKDQKRTIN